MKAILPLILCQLCLLAGANAADLVTLKDGRQIAGAVESGDNASLKIRVGDNRQEIALTTVQSIAFGSPADQALGQNCLTLPAGTEIAVRTVDRIDSKTADKFHEYAASLDDPIVVDGVTVAPPNADAFLKAVEIHNVRIGRAKLSIVLVAVVINGRRVEVKTGPLDSQSGSRAKRTLTGTAVGAGTGAAIGGLAGGAVGAGVGAGVGAAAGTLAGIATAKGVEIASEVRFTYKLNETVSIHALALRNGSSVTGTWSGVDARQVVFHADGQDKTYPRADVLQVAFSPAPAAVVPPPPPPPQAYEQIQPPPPPADSTAAPKPTIGQTIDEVVAQLGQPTTVADLGDKKLYVFKNWKLTFVDGKLSVIVAR